MAVPKRKTTKSRAGKRRSHIQFNTKNQFKLIEKFIYIYPEKSPTLTNSNLYLDNDITNSNDLNTTKDEF